ncbi:MAG: hypothetical protein RL757_1659 [Bacteroidota bacterium]
MNFRIYGSKNRSSCCLFAAFILGGGHFLAAQTPNVANNIEVTAERRINSTFQEYSPAFFENGLVFISSNPDATQTKKEDERTGKFTTSIFLARRGEDGSLQKPEPFSQSLTTKLYEGPLTFDAQQQQIFFTRSNQRFGKPEPSEDGKVKLKIYAAQRKKDNTWTKPALLNINNDKEADFAHPSISYDGSRLIFCSNRKGGRGGTDLYMCLKKTNKKGESEWSDPVSLGLKINTSGNEMFPHLHADGTLFFASTGHKGLGGLDIFFTRMTDTGWLSPQHLPAPINSRSDDFGLIADLDQKNGYFSSNRPGGEGDDDIYRFFAKEGLTTPPHPTFEATILATDRETQQPLKNVIVNYAPTAQTKNSAILTDSSGNIIALKTSDGGEMSLAQVAWKTDTTDSEGKIKVFMEEGQYIFDFANADYAPRHIVKTMYKQDNRVLGQLEKVDKNIDKPLEKNNSNPIVDNKAVEPDEFEETPKTNQKVEVGVSQNKKKEEKNIEKTIEKPIEKIAEKTPEKGNEKRTEKTSDKVENIGKLGSVREGTIIKLPNVYYNYNDADLRPESRSDLQTVVDLMKKYKSLRIEIQSHTDARASAEYNLQLSQRRADNILEYLVANDIARERLSAVGYGESFPKNRCLDSVPCSEAEYRINRRTEIKIVKLDDALANATFEQADVAVRKRINEPRPKNARSTPSETPPPSISAQNPPKIAPLKFDTTLVQPKTGKEICYLLVIGTYSKTDNAMKQLQRALDFGFIDAEIVDYPQTHLKAVCLKRFKETEKAEAEEMAKTVSKDQQFEIVLKIYQF